MLLGVDVGGTFTDAVLVGKDGAVVTAKVPSTPRNEEQGVVRAIEQVLARAHARTRTRAHGPNEKTNAHPALTAPDSPPTGPPRPHAREVERFAHGMTVATNALLEMPARPPGRTALVATEGFGDVVELGRQARASLYRLCEEGPKPLAPPELRFEATERTGPDGVLRELDDGAARALADRLAEAGPEGVAVVLLHSYAHPEHERRLGELISQALPEAHVSLSHELVGTFREYERASTTEIDAALSPLLAKYLARLGERCEEAGLPEAQVMQSSGGLTDAAHAGRHAALTVLSGPAGGVAGALLLSEARGEKDVLCFDMGGTSCDVCLIADGRVGETAERKVAGRPMALPALDIHTVGAGGGSIAWRDAGGALRVGPHSAGADPGPACYGKGGEEPTVTDANLVLGRLLADAPLAGGVRLDRAAAEGAVKRLADELGLSLVACAEGIAKVAETEMRRALSVMTVERGIDPRGYALLPFGGAGGLHAAAMAEEMGMERIVAPRASGVLSALGLAAAAPRRDVSKTVMLSGEALTHERIAAELEALLQRATEQLDAPADRAEARYELRYEGQSFELTLREDIDLPVLGDGPLSGPRGVPAAIDGDPPSQGLSNASKPPGLRDPGALRRAFEDAHEQRYGYRDEESEVELVNMRVSVLGAMPRLRLGGATQAAATRERTLVALAGEWVETELWRGEPPAGTRVRGPALCAMPESTLLVPPGWAGEVDELGTAVLGRQP